MINDDEFYKLISEKIENFKGDSSLLNEAVGILVVGRLVGWEHQRMVTTSSVWYFTTKLFGDLKNPDLMPKRGRLAHKSMALTIADTAGSYLKIIKGKFSAPMAQRKVFE